MKYYYLVYSLFFLTLLAGVLWQRRDLVKDALPAFIFGAIAGPVSEILYFADYWRPPSILSIGNVHVEDVIFGVAIFGLALTIYPFVSSQKLGPVSSGNEKHLRTLGALGLGALWMIMLMGLLKLNSVFATSITFVILWLLICIRRRDLFWPGLITGVLFMGIALFVYGIFLNIFVTQQEMQAFWLLHGTRLGITIFGKVPVSELVWFFGTGTFLSIFELFVNQRKYQDL